VEIAVVVEGLAEQGQRIDARPPQPGRINAPETTAASTPVTSAATTMVSNGFSRAANPATTTRIPRRTSIRLR
jgi:hypothetical protein